MIANGFRHPFGNGVYTPEYDGDGFYISQQFDVPNTYFGGRHHRAEDWALESGLDVPLVSPGHGTVIDVGGNSSHGNYIVISHQLPYSIVFDGYETDSITTVHLHLSQLATHTNGRLVRIGDTLEAGQQFGVMGTTGQSGGLVHNHFEIRLDGDLPLRAGYEDGPVDLPWVDPTDFILAHRYLGAVTGTNTADAISANVGARLGDRRVRRRHRLRRRRRRPLVWQSGCRPPLRQRRRRPAVRRPGRRLALRQPGRRHAQGQRRQ